MAISIDSNLKLQPADQIETDADGVTTLTLVLKGAYPAARATADSINLGDPIPSGSVAGGTVPSGFYAASWDIRRGNGDTATLTIRGRKADATQSSQSGSSTTPFKDVFSLKSVRNDVSVLAYCSTSPSGPNRAAVERWMREPNPKLAAEFKYMDSDGNLVDMNEEPLLKNTVPLVRKIMKGTERVIRFYPQLTRRRSYYAPPADTFQHLSYIDTPPTPGGQNTLAPNGISTLISAHEWLKVQDDCDEQQDRTWMRTESWIGILKTDENEGHPWDPDLYGPNRWKMPHDTADQGEE